MDKIKNSAEETKRFHKYMDIVADYDSGLITEEEMKEKLADVAIKFLKENKYNKGE